MSEKDVKTDKYHLMFGDCLERMKEIPDGSVDMVLCDPPYGTTACAWDVIIPFESMWNHLNRVSRKYSAKVVFGQEPFSSILRISNISHFKYDWYWRKSRPSGFVNAKLKPLKDLEIISIFSDGTTANKSDKNMTYFPQGVEKTNKVWNRPKRYEDGDRGVNPSRKSHSLERIIEFSGYPRQILDFPNTNKGLLHPTQKPVALMEYLIKTYTNEGETVLDFTMGSGTTGVAALNLKRNFIGIEKEEKYFEIAKSRISEVAERKTVESFFE